MCINTFNRELVTETFDYKLRFTLEKNIFYQSIKTMHIAARQSRKSRGAMRTDANDERTEASVLIGL